MVSPQQNLVGPQRSLFPLRIALFFFRLFPATPSTPEYRLISWCKAVYRLVGENKGVRYAKELAKSDGGHSSSGNERAVAAGETSEGSQEGATPEVESPQGGMPTQGPYEVIAGHDEDVEGED